MVLVRVALATLLVVFSASCSRSRGKAEPPRPRLVVVVVIDGLGQGQLHRVRASLNAHGLFVRLADSEASYINCHHRHASTETAVGHATLLTGAFANVNGIVGNDCFDRQTGKWAPSVHDPDCPLVGLPPPPPPIPATTSDDLPYPAPTAIPARPRGVSPRRLLAATVGDMLKLETGGKGRVFGVSLKDRAAVLMAGHAADGAFWFDSRSGRWISSHYYCEQLPEYLEAFNRAERSKAYLGKTWTLLEPADSYIICRPDDSGYEGTSPMTPGFPHHLADTPGKAYMSTMLASPFGNDMTLEVARMVVASEQLGQDDFPDLLAINLASHDYVNHAFGPYSLEAQDMTLRVDRQLADFVAFLDGQLKGGPYVLVITSDHGCGPIPEFLEDAKLPAGRNLLDEFDLRDRLEEELRSQLGEPSGGDYIQELTDNEVYLNRDLPELAGEKYPAAQRIVRDLLLERDEVSAAFTRETLLTAGATDGLLGQFRLTFHPRRSGDVLFALAPGCIQTTTPATHGSPWRFDTHVPLLLSGPGIRSGRFSRPVSPADIAPTLSRLLGIPDPPSCQVEPLGEVLGE